MRKANPSKKGRSESSNLDSQIKALVEQNKTLSSKVDNLVQFQSSQLDVVTKAVGLQQSNRFPKTRQQPNQDSSNPAGRIKEGTPYLGKVSTSKTNGWKEQTAECHGNV